MNSRDNDRIDRWLDGALREFGAAEPRAGLENRVLASLAAARANSHRRVRWGFVIAAAASICLVMAAVWIGGRSTRQSTSTLSAGVVTTQDSPPGKEVADVRKPANTPKRAHVRFPAHMETARAGTEPRLEQFPSPRPLSEQETLLVEFVRNSPKEAVLVAKVQAETEKELNQLMTGRVSNGESTQKKR